MSERGLPIADGAAACPFVAFEDDRDERATVPDHRHRCYAEVRPAPRALAHQEAYCLSTAFPVCPTFQDWARREAARARDAAAATAAAGRAAADRAPDVDGDPPQRSAAEVDGAPPATAATPIPAPPSATAPEIAALDESPGDDSDRATRGAESSNHDHDDDEPPIRDPHDDDEPRRNPPREWSAPPPWLASSEARHGAPAEPPDFLAGRSEPGHGLAGSAADLLAGGSPPRPAPPGRSVLPPDLPPRAAAEHDVEEHDVPRPAARPRRPRAYEQHLGGPTSGPDWERPRRHEAYPTIRTRIGLPSVPRLAGMAAAVALAAVALFFLPALLGLGSGDQGGGSPSPAASPSRSLAPTPTPAPTPILYIIKKGDFLSKIAAAHGVTLEALMAANPDIKDPNKIIVGQQITIPLPVTEVPGEFGGSASPSAATSP